MAGRHDDSSRPDRGRTILAAGALAGGLDLAWAIATSLLHGRSPVRMLQGIASGLLGAAAFEGGHASALFGLCLHFLIAMSAAALYVGASTLWPGLHRHLAISGPLYGVGVYVFMQTIVLPLSRIGWRWSWQPRDLIAGLAAHVLCVGLPIAAGARRKGEPPSD